MTKLSLLLTLFYLISCNGDSASIQNTSSVTKENDATNSKAVQSNFISNPDTIHTEQLKYFNPIVFYTEKDVDTAAFLRKVAFKYTFNELYFDTIYNAGNDNSKIVVFDTTVVYGSNQKLFTLFIEHPEYATASLPNQALFVFNAKGKLLLFQSHCGIFKKIKILSNEGPFLLTSEETGKGNGTHRLYMCKNDTLVNVLNTGDWDIHTIDGHGDENEYDPFRMTIGVKDINKDGNNDLEFSTTLVVDCNSKTIRKKLVYHFLFNPKTKLFNPAGNYSFDNNYNLCK